MNLARCMVPIRLELSRLHRLCDLGTCAAPVRIPARYRRFHAGDRGLSLPCPGPR